MTAKTRAPRKSTAKGFKKRVDAALTQLTQVELVKPHLESSWGDRAYFFKHALVQDTAQSSLLHGEHKRLNLLVARAYEKVYDGRAMDEFATVLAQHYAAAGDRAKTIEYATRAGDLAAQVYANAEAIVYYTQALDAAKAMDAKSTNLTVLFNKRGRILELLSRYDAALENYWEMETVARNQKDPAMELAASMARATIHSTPNAKFDPSTARALSENALTLARALHDPTSEAKILWNLMLLAHFGGHFEEAVAFGEQSIALARTLNLTERLAYALNDISRPLQMSGKTSDAIAALDEARKLWRQLGNQPMLSDNLNSLGAQLFNRGEYDKAVAYATEGYGIGEAINNRWAQAFGLTTLAFIYLDRGEIAKSIETMQACLPLAQEVGFLISITSLNQILALTYADMGDAPRGLALIESQKPLNQNLANLEKSSLALRAQLYVRQGDIAHARALVTESKLYPEYGAPSPFQVGSTLLADTEVALAEQDYSHALESSQELLAKVAEHGARYYVLYLKYLNGLALFHVGRPDEAEKILSEARASAEYNQARRNLWRILALLGDIQAQRENREKAAELYAQAREVLAFVVAHTPAEYRASFLNMPPVRAVMP
jgi:tetratricopeptide (TPR) repeat protein